MRRVLPAFLKSVQKPCEHSKEREGDKGGCVLRTKKGKNGKSQKMEIMRCVLDFGVSKVSFKLIPPFDVYTNL